MDISKYNKAEILAELYNNSRPLGLEILQYTSEDMKINEAEELLKKQTYFDYLNGRVMKIDLSTNDLRTDLYNRDNGFEAAEKIISKLRIK